MHPETRRGRVLQGQIPHIMDKRLGFVANSERLCGLAEPLCAQQSLEHESVSGSTGSAVHAYLPLCASFDVEKRIDTRPQR